MASRHGVVAEVSTLLGPFGASRRRAPCCAWYQHVLGGGETETKKKKKRKKKRKKKKKGGGMSGHSFCTGCDMFRHLPQSNACFLPFFSFFYFVSFCVRLTKKECHCCGRAATLDGFSHG